jgi:hypothetical protein
MNVDNFQLIQVTSSFKVFYQFFFQRQDHVEKHCDVANFPFDFDSGEAIKDKKMKIIGKIGKIHLS